ncbi:6,7-dimethyl-8-ribityllumazine synthase [Neorickettsia helminthoeca str. Oregon]|uniref:6,7-dimethyl-8-ribityllumazine synthase n=1 Tax=Neorickettsia helminthoeca str. Oregon TaxID=1286528 RepID=X5GW83_9RICK|nr:6,7-dimethyl-8-ribityllumazine synthase [Neorickettsia helminthoeca]AHX11332.1 6,7-dimethyl-8-ribityllumazine synthase [Neorickettsia helminthoeca str. Oregon]
MRRKILVICSKVNPEICKKLYETAIEELKQRGLRYKAVYVPGAFELPSALNLLQADCFLGYVLLGCIIRSGTPHFDYVSSEACRGIMQVSLEKNLALGFGVITANNMEQALERIVPYAKAAVAACVSMINLKERSRSLFEEESCEDSDL